MSFLANMFTKSRRHFVRLCIILMYKKNQILLNIKAFQIKIELSNSLKLDSVLRIQNKFQSKT